MNKIYTMLERIEQLLLSNKTTFTVAEFSAYSGLSKSAIHKLTQRKRIRYSKPNGKLIFISKESADFYLQSNPVIPDADIEKMAINYTINNPRKRWDQV